jgi:signal transduction histidine kinase
MPDALTRAVSTRARRIDAGLALALAIWSAIQLRSGPPLARDVVRAELVCVAVCCVALLARSTRPLAASVLVSVTITVAGLLTGPAFANALPYASQVVITLLSYSVGAHERGWRAWLGLACVVLAVNGGDVSFADPVPMFVFGIPPWAAGRALQSRRIVAVQLAARARELELERARFAHESVRHERARIARELHDIVAHCVSMMVVQASAGQRLADRDPAAAAQSLALIADTAERAQSEMGRLVELLGSDTPAAESNRLAAISELIEKAQGSGLPVTGDLGSSRASLAPDVTDVAYRVIQESLTNALKHAPGAKVQITLRDQRNQIELTVINGASRTRRSGLESSGGGFGLGGMSERVASCGGTLQAGPTPDGGWCVTAKLPGHTRAGSS